MKGSQLYRTLTVTCTGSPTSLLVPVAEFVGNEMQTDAADGTFVLPPAPFCFNCQHHQFEWIELPGTGTIYSFTVVRHPLSPHLQAVVPYVTGVIELDGTQGAGARMLANIVDCDPDTVRIGDAVRIEFEKVSDTYAVPRFTPK